MVVRRYMPSNRAEENNRVQSPPTLQGSASCVSPPGSCAWERRKSFRMKGLGSSLRKLGFALGEKYAKYLKWRESSCEKGAVFSTDQTSVYLQMMNDETMFARTSLSRPK